MFNGIAAIIVLVTFLCGGLITLGLYIFISLTHMKALQKMNYQNAWMAWIPFLAQYAMADATRSNDEQTYILDNLSVPTQYFVYWIAVSVLVSFIPGIGSAASLVVTVLCQGYVYKQMFAYLSNDYYTGNAVNRDDAVWAYVGAAFSLVASIKFIMINKKNNY